MTRFIVVLILSLGLILRLTNYQHQPPRGASSDEYTYSFLGMSLLTTGVPTSWSFIPGYDTLGEKKIITIDNIVFPIVSPYFDHPPFAGILVGGWALINGENTFQKITIHTIRQIPIFLGMVSSLLVFILAHKIYGRKTAFWALLIYSTSTIIVMQTRSVFAENILTPILLFSLLILSSPQKKLSVLKIIVLSILAGLAFWTKELGVVVFVSTLLILIHEKVNKKLIVIYSILSLFFMSLYLLYGYIYNWELFRTIVFAQATRVTGPQTLYNLFFNPIIVNERYNDGWYFVGFLAFFYAFINFSKNKLFLVPSLVYFFLLLFSLTKEGEMGWYMIPLFPIFSILTASLLVQNIKEKGWFIFVVVLFIGMYLTQYRIELKYGLTTPGFRIILAILFLPLLIFGLFNNKKIFTLLSNAWFYILIFGTALVTYRYIHPL